MNNNVYYGELPITNRLSELRKECQAMLKTLNDMGAELDRDRQILTEIEADVNKIKNKWGF